MLLFNRTLVCLLALQFVSVIGPSGRAAAQLPPENVLPGQNVPPVVDFPGEDVLPGQSDQGTAKAATMPGEDAYPGDPPNPNEPNVSAPVAGLTPTLRLAFEGHTGLIRSLDVDRSGRTMVTGGDDKDLHVWRRTDLNKSGWLHHKTVRWPVGRGPRGLIYQARLKNDLVAFGGYAAFGALGEIRIANAASGDLVTTLVDTAKGHRQVILSLAWSPQTHPRLASLDMTGQVNLWEPDLETGKWETVILIPNDSTTYGDQTGPALQSYRRFGAITFNGPHHIIVPYYVGITAKEPQGYPKWHLRRIDLRNPNGPSQLLNETDHLLWVSSLISTNDGRVLASHDGYSGNVSLWNFGEDGKLAASRQLQASQTPTFIQLDESGKRLLVGCLPGNEQGSTPSLEVWNIEPNPPVRLSSKSLAGLPASGAIDSERREVIVGIENEVLLLSLDEKEQIVDSAQRLDVPVKPIHKLAFAKDGSYKIAFGWSDKFDGVFDLSENELIGSGKIKSEDFLDPQSTRTKWQWTQPADASWTYQLLENDQPRGVLPLVLERQGQPTVICTLPKPDSQPGAELPEAGAVIVGSTGQNNIYAYRADNANPPELLRQFRDHSGFITALATSADGKYLVSGSADTTISVWNLQDLFTATKMVNRWGCDFEIEGDQLLAVNVREDGPLYFRGVRSGDQLRQISWGDLTGQIIDEIDPVKMQDRLLDLPVEFMLKFQFSRMRRPVLDFQSYPAWRPLASLFVDQSRQWAYWTPAGYYNASFNGHQLFGWQINRSIDQEIEYYRAAQFKQLERPDVIRGLLKAGSLAGAMRATVAGIGAPPADSAIVNQIESTPRIRLLTPDPGKKVVGDVLTVTAEIETPVGASLVTPKAFVSGVPAVKQQMIANRADAEPNVVTYQWDFRLPLDQQLQLEILAATESESLDRLLIGLDHEPSDRPKRRRLHVLAIGASEYRDPQITSLDFAADAAARVSKLFRDQSSTLYETSADQLVNSDATRPLWRVFAQNAAEKLSQTVSPDDLVIMYLCGHGLRDRQTNQWYFVTADARYSDLMHDRYDDCIAFSDLSALASLPCRKLAILDSCHSGAVQPVMRREDLKSALRFLQDDVVLTMTASEGDEEAAEKRETGLGRFTTKLVEALEGAADANCDGEVMLNEAIEYVTRQVSEESEQDGMPQHPTASPDYLLRTLQLPLTAQAR